MSEFRRISKTSSFVTGSIESDTGSQYLFGYSDVDGLMWLERKGLQYSASDKEWRKAESFLRSSLSSDYSASDKEWRKAESFLRSSLSSDFDADGAGDVEEDYEVEEQRPVTVRRSIAAEYDMGTPQLTSSMVGMGGSSIDDDDLAGRAIQFLSGSADDFEEPEDYEEEVW